MFSLCNRCDKMSRQFREVFFLYLKDKKNVTDVYGCFYVPPVKDRVSRTCHMRGVSVALLQWQISDFFLQRKLKTRY